MIRFLTALPGRRPALVLALGVFDAVHLGHRGIIDAARRLAQQRGAKCAAVTFFPHPREVLFHAPPILLLTQDERVARLLETGCDAVGMIDFTPDFARMTPDDFCRALRDEKSFRLSGVVVGSMWRFGADASGNAASLYRALSPSGIETLAVAEKMYGNDVISTSRIREAISGGKLADASAMLGRPVTLRGKVAHGFGDATKLLETPTVNVELLSGALPPDGVYSGRAILPSGEKFAAAVNIGVAPTFDGRGRRIEAHLLDFHGDLYEKEVCIELLDFIRSEKKFSSPDELKKQIASDLGICRKKSGS